jgi:hypothetical protein
MSGMQNGFDVTQMPALANNVFGIANPETYICRVASYRAGHSVMCVHVHRHSQSTLPYDEFFLLFDFVQYFEGPMWWNGANFCTSTPEECLQLLFRLQSPQKVDDDEVTTFDLPESTPLPKVLFVQAANNVKVRLIVSFVTMLSTLPDFMS